jgi:hypothetical protein
MQKRHERVINFLAIGLGVFILLVLLSLGLTVNAQEAERVIWMSGNRDAVIFTKTAEITTFVSVIWGIPGTPGLTYEFPSESEVITVTVPSNAETLHVSVGSEWELKTSFTPLGEGWYQIPEPERFEVFLPLVATPPKVIRMSGNRNEVRFEKSSSEGVEAHVLWGVEGTPKEDIAWDGNVATLTPPADAATMWFRPPGNWRLETDFVAENDLDWWKIPPVHD